MKSKDVKITVVPYEQSLEEDFQQPSKFSFRSAIGDVIFVHTRNRADAEQYVKDEWGGRYSVRCSGTEKSTKNLTVTGTATRKGQKKY